MTEKMKIAIWSDIMCPYCYIGKRRIEKALELFDERAHVEIEWKSYQIYPNIDPLPGQSLEEAIAVAKNVGIEEVRQMNAQATRVADTMGITLRIDRAVPANTFNAHRFIHFAKQFGKQAEAEEILFASFFTDGKNIDDYPTLVELGAEIGLNGELLLKALESGSFTDDVAGDIREGKLAGLNILPFYVLDEVNIKAGIQAPRVLLKAIQDSYDQWKSRNNKN